MGGQGGASQTQPAGPVRNLSVTLRLENCDVEGISTMESVFDWHWVECGDTGQKMQQKLVKEPDGSYTLTIRRRLDPAEVEVLLELESAEKAAAE